MEFLNKSISIPLCANVGDTFFVIEGDVRNWTIHKYMVIGIEITHRIGYANPYEKDERCKLNNGFTRNLRYTMLSDNGNYTYWDNSSFESKSLYYNAEDAIIAINNSLVEMMSKER